MMLGQEMKDKKKEIIIIIMWLLRIRLQFFSNSFPLPFCFLNANNDTTKQTKKKKKLPLLGKSNRIYLKIQLKMKKLFHFDIYSKLHR